MACERDSVDSSLAFDGLTRGAAGMDLRAAVDTEEPMVLAPGRRALVPTGFIFGW